MPMTPPWVMPSWEWSTLASWPGEVRTIQMISWRCILNTNRLAVLHRWCTDHSIWYLLSLLSPFDTFDGHVMVNFIEVSTVSLITQKLFLDHLNNWHFLGLTPYHNDRLGRHHGLSTVSTATIVIVIVHYFGCRYDIAEQGSALVVAAGAIHHLWSYGMDH